MKAIGKYRHTQVNTIDLLMNCYGLHISLHQEICEYCIDIHSTVTILSNYSPNEVGYLDLSLENKL